MSTCGWGCNPVSRLLMTNNNYGFSEDLDYYPQVTERNETTNYWLYRRLRTTTCSREIKRKPSARQQHNFKLPISSHKNGRIINSLHSLVSEQYEIILKDKNNKNNRGTTREIVYQSVEINFAQTLRGMKGDGAINTKFNKPNYPRVP